MFIVTSLPYVRDVGDFLSRGMYAGWRLIGGVCFFFAALLSSLDAGLGGALKFYYVFEAAVFGGNFPLELVELF